MFTPRGKRDAPPSKHGGETYPGMQGTHMALLKTGPRLLVVDEMQPLARRWPSLHGAHGLQVPWPARFWYVKSVGL